MNVSRRALLAGLGAGAAGLALAGCDPKTGQIIPIDPSGNGLATLLANVNSILKGTCQVATIGLTVAGLFAKGLTSAEAIASQICATLDAATSQTKASLRRFGARRRKYGDSIELTIGTYQGVPIVVVPQ